LTNLCR